MKARVKATGEIVEILGYVYDKDGEEYLLEEIEFNESDYWTRLEHQYAGMAMQGIMANSLFMPYDGKEIAELSDMIATALVEKLKEKEERK